MLMVSDAQSREGMKLATMIVDCHNDFLECLWNRGEYHPDCNLVLFRKNFESQSPAFFGMFKSLSRYDLIMKNLRESEDGTPQQKYAARMKFNDMQTFAEASLAALYPLYLSNDEIVPFLKVEEVKKVRKEYLIRDFKEAKEELEEIGLGWFSSVAAISTSFFEGEIWGKRIYFLISAFLRGSEKGSAGSIFDFNSKKEGEELFNEIEKFLGF